MSDSWNLATVSWLLVSVVEVLLLVFVLYRRQYRSHPLFTLYVFSLVLQTTVAFLAYRRWGAGSWQYFNVAWLSQASVVCARWLAVVEIARKVFVRYSGVWRLASIILLTMSLGVLVYSILAAGSRFSFIVLAAGRGVELCIALFIVAVFVSARYYRLPMVDAERQPVLLRLGRQHNFVRGLASVAGGGLGYLIEHRFSGQCGHLGCRVARSGARVCQQLCSRAFARTVRSAFHGGKLPAGRAQRPPQPVVPF